MSFEKSMNCKMKNNTLWAGNFCLRIASGCLYWSLSTIHDYQHPWWYYPL